MPIEGSVIDHYDVMGGKVIVNINGDMHVFVLSCKYLMCKHKNMHVSMYFLHLVLTFTPPPPPPPPHCIITDKGDLTLQGKIHLKYKDLLGM